MSAPPASACVTSSWVRLRASRSSSVSGDGDGERETESDARRVVVDADLDADGEVPAEALLGRPDEVAHEVGFAEQGAADALVVRPLLRTACVTRDTVSR